MATETAATQIPAGTWTLDPVHSVATFGVRHMAVGTFRGEFTELDATLTDGKLVGKVKVASLKLKNESLQGHLMSPEFFDAERYPELVYESSSLKTENGVLTSEGTLTVKDHTVPATATGEIRGPAVTMGDVEKIGIDLETTVDRNDIGMPWQAPLPQGGVALGNDVTISVTLEFARADDEG